MKRLLFLLAIQYLSLAMQPQETEEEKDKRLLRECITVLLENPCSDFNHRIRIPFSNPDARREAAYPIHAVCKYDSMHDLARQLLKRDATPWYTNDSNNAVHICAQFQKRDADHLNALTIFQLTSPSRVKDMLNQENYARQTPLDFLLEKKFVISSAFYLHHGARISTRNIWSALSVDSSANNAHEELCYQNKQCLAVLLQYGLSMDHINRATSVILTSSPDPHAYKILGSFQQVIFLRNALDFYKNKKNRGRQECFLCTVPPELQNLLFSFIIGIPFSYRKLKYENNKEEVGYSYHEKNDDKCIVS